MAFKYVVLAALLAVARAGVPIGLAAAPLHYAAPVAKVAAAPAVSYSSITHAQPAVAYAAAPALTKVAYAAPTFTKFAAPAVSYAAPAFAAHTVHSYAAPAAIHSYAAPALHSYAAPALHSYAAPAVHSYAAPAVSYAAPIVTKYAAPAVHSYAAPVVAKYAAAPVIAKTVVAEHSAPANYEFEYSVHDPHTGDEKSQKEVRHGDAVQGSYSLIEADGSKRIVEYTADAHNGFNAVVHREHNAHPVAVKTVAAPLVAKVAAPAYAYGAHGYLH